MCVADVERLAGERLPPDIWDFVAGGSGDESTQAANRACLDRVCLVPRVLTTAAEGSMAGRLVRSAVAMPVAVAPMAYQRLCHPDGEIAAARAASKAGVPFTVSTLSSVPIEEIAAVAGPLWFQLYWLRDRGLVLDLVARAERAGCEALMVTVDVPIMGRRLRDVRNEFVLPPSVVAANLVDGTGSAAHVPAPRGSAVAAHTGAAFEAALGWDDLAWLREHTDLPVVLKGVLDPRDAVRAAESGVAAVVVSNHGGRQLAGAVPSIVALPPVVEAVAGRCDVLLDSGIRTGTDVLRALACGAEGVLLGRPMLWGLAADGEAGAGLVLDLLRVELREAMLLAGCADLAAARELSTVLI
ncbi:alpha-hydroxy acid oxidase [Streptosporangium sp. NPDC051023]|uniref:alpha-hydroxy acid oxidase n=1 Tax=Streptosporangium sp. NPDC051023 TaxID=3155410 RepID=UPI00344D925A